jgi:hypothetical protein
MPVLEQMPLDLFRARYGENETRRRIDHDRAQRFSREKKVYEPKPWPRPKVQPAKQKNALMPAARAKAPKKWRRRGGKKR